MTEQELAKANNLNKEIEELESFIWSAERIWTGKIIKRDTKYIFRANGYGAFNDVDYNMNTEMKNKVLNVLKEHLKDLKKQLGSI